jgi:hypothetical protein
MIVGFRGFGALKSIIISEKVFGNNFPYEGAAIFERILKCATKHASAGNASEERDSGKSSSSLGKEFFKYLLRIGIIF